MTQKAFTVWYFSIAWEKLHFSQDLQFANIAS